MTPSQFEAIAMLARMRPHSKAREAARRYMLESKTQPAIAQELGIAQPTVSQAVQRFMKAWKASRLV
jgi:DNA-binding MarR family transcriptional regulator